MDEKAKRVKEKIEDFLDQNNISKENKYFICKSLSDDFYFDIIEDDEEDLEDIEDDEEDLEEGEEILIEEDNKVQAKWG